MTPAESKLFYYVFIAILTAVGLIFAAVSDWKVVASDMLILLSAYLYSELK